MRQTFLVAAALMLLFSSCREIFAKRIRGNGNITTQTRSAGEFHSVDVSGNIDVYASQDSLPSISVETDENLQQLIETIESGGVLRIRERPGFHLRSTKPIKVHVSSPSFKKFEASGACDVYGESKITSASDIRFDLSGSCKVEMDVSAPKIAVDMSGVGTIKLKGETKDFKVQGSGSTDVKCIDLVAENVDLDISGAGDAEVYANGKLTGTISGAANVRYRGNAQTDIHTSGATSVNKVN